MKSAKVLIFGSTLVKCGNIQAAPEPYLFHHGHALCDYAVALIPADQIHSRRYYATPVVWPVALLLNLLQVFHNAMSLAGSRLKATNVQQ